MKKLFALSILFCTALCVRSQDEKLFLDLSAKDSSLLFKHGLELVWGNENQSTDFFAIAPNGDYFSYNIGSQNVQINSPDFSRKKIFKVESMMNIGIWRTVEQPIFMFENYICLSTTTGQYFFFLEGNEWKSVKQNFPKELKFGEIKIIKAGEKRVYAATLGNDDYEILDKSFSEIGFIEEEGNKIVPKYRLNLDKKPVRYVGYKFFQVFENNNNLIVLERIQKKIYVLDEYLNVKDSLSLKKELPEELSGMYHLLQDVNDKAVYLVSYGKDKNNAFLREIIFDEKLRFSTARNIPFLYPLWMQNHEIYFGVSTNKNAKLTPSSSLLGRMIYKMKFK